MNKPGHLDYQVNRFGFWSAVVVIITSVVAMLLPLDAPEAYNAEHAHRIEPGRAEHRAAQVHGFGCAESRTRA